MCCNCSSLQLRYRVGCLAISVQLGTQQIRVNQCEFIIRVSANFCAHMLESKPAIFLIQRNSLFSRGQRHPLDPQPHIFHFSHVSLPNGCTIFSLLKSPAIFSFTPFLLLPLLHLFIFIISASSSSLHRSYLSFIHCTIPLHATAVGHSPHCDNFNTKERRILSSKVLACRVAATRR